MAVTVKEAFVRFPAKFYVQKNGNVRLLGDNFLCMKIERKKVVYNVVVHFQKNYENDGLSRPEFAKKWIKKFDPDNSLYNFAGAVHDWLYSVKGDGKFSRSECDDIFRGVLREAGISRFKAGMMDWAVGVFAGNSRHWGNDSFKVKNLVKIEEYRPWPIQ